jgi:hypothetical protein
MAEKGSSPGRRKSGGAKRDEQGEHLQGKGWKTALIEGATFPVKAVQYTEVDGLAMFEGDIVLGTVEEVEQRTQMLRDVQSGTLQAGVMITGANRRWPNCQVPYDIDSNMPDQARVTDAIAHWEANTRFRFVLRTPQNAAQFPDWVTFRSGSGCSSTVGKAGGQQFVNLGSGCTKGNAIHEIGHTIGLWHEQSREDRDSFVTIHWDKIQAGMEHNFDQHISDGDDIGAYDYGSIMHYPRNAFSTDGSDTITPIDPNAQIGQRTALSAGDIAAANSICPPKSFKEGPKDPIKEAVKDVRLDTIKEKTKDVRLDTIKEQTKDVRLDTVKEQVLDTFKEQVSDTIKEGAFDPVNPGGTWVEQPGPVVGPQVGPQIGPQVGPAPFAVATGHQAPALAGGGAAGPGDAGATAQALDAELQQIAASLQQLQQHYDELHAQLQAVLAAEGGAP